MSEGDSKSNQRKAGLPRLILLFLGVDWPLYMRRPAVMAVAEAAREYQSTVVAVDRPLCPFSTPLRKPDRIGELLGRSKCEQLAENLYLYKPRYVIHDHVAGHVRVLEALNLAALRRGLCRLQQRLRIDEPRPIVWFNYPQQGYVARLFAGGFTVFELYDELADIDGRSLRRAATLEQHQRGHVDLLLTTSKALDDKYGRYYEHRIMYGNGVSESTFSRLSTEPGQPSSALAAIGRPRLGYAGMLSDRLDWSLIVGLAQARPDWQLVFVGPIVDEALIRLCRPQANIHFLGAVAPDQLPGVLGSFDVGLLPYRDTAFFHFLNPLKFYEMAAAGLPMVSSPIEELRQYPAELVRVVDNDIVTWQAAIERALSIDRAAIRRIGRKVAGKFIWEDMAQRLLERMAGMIQNTGSP